MTLTFFNFVLIAVAAGAPKAGATKAPSTQPVSTSAWATYENKRDNVRLKYPPAWRKQIIREKTGDMVVVMLDRGPDEDPDAISFSAHPGGQSDEAKTPEQLKADAEWQLKGWEGNILIESSPTQLAGIPAHRVIFKTPTSKDPHTTLTVLASQGRDSYSFMYVSPMSKFDANRPIAEAVLNSITWVAPAPPSTSPTTRAAK